MFDCQLIAFADGHYGIVCAQCLRQLLRAVARGNGVEARRQVEQQDIFRSQNICIHDGGYGAVDAAGKTDGHAFDAALLQEFGGAVAQSAVYGFRLLWQLCRRTGGDDVVRFCIPGKF